MIDNKLNLIDNDNIYIHTYKSIFETYYNLRKPLIIYRSIIWPKSIILLSSAIQD